MRVKAHSTDSENILLTVHDLVAKKDVVVDAPVTGGGILDVDILQDAGQGRVKWRAVRADDPNVHNSGEATLTREDELFYVKAGA